MRGGNGTFLMILDDKLNDLFVVGKKSIVNDCISLADPYIIEKET